MAITSAGALLTAGTGCSLNLFGLFDQPGDDAQVLSAARGCMDRGDFRCAQSQYARLAGTSYSDLASSEYVIAAIDEQGATLNVFLTAIVATGGNTGKLITRLATAMAPRAGESARLSLFAAYQRAITISTPRLRGLARFLSALALASEVLAEDAGSDGTFADTDLATTPSTCIAAGAGCGAAPSCLVPAGKLITSGPAPATLGTLDLNNAATSLAGAPNLLMIAEALNEVNDAVTTDLSGGGGTTSNAGSSAATIVAVALVADPADSPCFRQALLVQGVGVP